MNIRKKILTYFILLSIVPILILLLLTTTQLENKLEKKIANDLENSAIHVSLIIEKFLNERQGDMISLSRNPVMISDESSIEEKLNELTKISNVYRFYDDLTLIDKTGTVITSTTYNYRGEWLTKRWFEKALQGDVDISEAHVILNPFKIVIQYTAPIYDKEDNVKAVVAAQLDLKHLWDIIKELKIGETGYFYIVNENDRFIVSSNQSKLFEKSDHPITACGRGNRIIIDNDGKRFLEGYNSLVRNLIYEGEGCWNIIAAQKEDEAFKLIRIVKTQIIIIFISVLLIAGISSQLFSRSMSRQITNLLEIVNKITKGDLKAKVKIESDDELSELGKAFNHMTDELQKSKKALEKYNLDLEKKVKARTKELEDKNEELARFNKIAVGRELRMIDLKKKLKEAEEEKKK